MNPLSAIFGAGVSLRNALYDRGVFKIRKLTRPVVSVGNISVGGSGKTPLVMALGRLFKARGIAFDVLSRGYGRGANEIAVVDPQGSPQQFGDEPLLIARQLQVPVVVAADRYQAGLLAESKFATQLHLLDDGFQHRRLHRDFDIVVLRAEDLRDVLLPIGRLREPVSALRRADVAVTFAPDAFESKPVWAARREMIAPKSASKVIAFCGIARPGQFFAGLSQLGMEIAETLVFSDHHQYTTRDIDHLLQAQARAGAAGFITTEKDEVNLGELAERLRPLQIAQLRVTLENPEQAMSTLLSTLEQRCGCRF